MGEFIVQSMDRVAQAACSPSRAGLSHRHVEPVGFSSTARGGSMIMSERAAPAGNHGEDVVFLDHLGVDDAGAVVVFHGRLEHAVHVGRAAQMEALDAVGLGQLDEIRDCPRESVPDRRLS